jgi:hypothetical protein
MADQGTPPLTLADLLAGRDAGRVERYRAVLGLADDAAIVAVAWATVDVERTMRELGNQTKPSVADEPLGAKGVRILDSDPAIIVLEPVTEGRLAACLARHGEGICALYLEASEVPAEMRTTGLGRGGRIGAGSPRFGPFIVEVAPALPEGRSATLGAGA